MPLNPVDRGPAQPSQAAHLDSDHSWTRWSHAAWRQLADPAGSYPHWNARLRETADHMEKAGAVVSWFELGAFARGWRRGAIGLARWAEIGHPTDHPVLLVRIGSSVKGHRWLAFRPLGRPARCAARGVPRPIVYDASPQGRRSAIALPTRSPRGWCQGSSATSRIRV